MAKVNRYDILIIGSGFGGATAAHVLKDTGASILILERGGFLRQEKQNWDITEVSDRGCGTPISSSAVLLLEEKCWI